MRLTASIKVSPRAKNLGKNSPKILANCIKEMSMDLHRVASERAPVKDGTLETSGQVVFKNGGTKFTGTVSFSAINRGFNYAQKMHNDTYALGAKSLAKSSRGVKSRFSTQTFRVGKGYLKDTAEKCQTGYKKYINKEVIMGLK